MTKKAMIENATKYLELDAKIDALKKQRDAIGTAIKTEMNKKGVEIYKVGIFIIRNTPVDSTRFDTTAFKEQHPKQYQKYLIATSSKRFKISK